MRVQMELYRGTCNKVDSFLMETNKQKPSSLPLTLLLSLPQFAQTSSLDSVKNIRPQSSGYDYIMQ